MWSSTNSLTLCGQGLTGCFWLLLIFPFYYLKNDLAYFKWTQFFSTQPQMSDLADSFFFFHFSILKYSVNILDLKSQTKNKKSVRLKSKFFNGENQKRVYWTISRPWNGKINHEVQKPMCKFRKERKYTLLFILKFRQFFKCFFFLSFFLYKYLQNSHMSQLFCTTPQLISHVSDESLEQCNKNNK